MQVQKDVLIAGGVVVVCVALVIVALVATSKKDTSHDLAPGSDSFVSSSPSPSGADSASSSSGLSDPNAFGGSGFGSGTQPATAPRPAGTDNGLAPSSPLTPSTAAPLGGISSSTQSSNPSDLFGGSTSSSPSMPPSATMPQPGAAPGTVSEAKGGGTHTIAKGETLGDISASHYGTAKHWAQIRDANPGLDPQRLKVGTVIQIPTIEGTSHHADAGVADGVTTYKVAKGEGYYIIAKKTLGSASRWRELENLNGIPAGELRAGTIIKLPAKNAVTPGSGGTHIIARGETLGDISRQYFGTSTKWQQIQEANPGLSPSNLKVGQSIVIPALPASAAPAATVASGNGYIVKKGDTLESIAATTLGKKSAWKLIVDANPGLNPRNLKVGQQIVIPGGAPSTDSTHGISAPPTGPNGTTGPGQTPAPIAPPAPTYKEDLFYNPYAAPPATPANGASGGNSAPAPGPTGALGNAPAFPSI